MVILDVSVVNVALPAIRNGLHFSEVDLQWVVNAYTVTFAGFLLLGGRAADLLGRRRVFVSGLVLFALASLAGGLARQPGRADRRAGGPGSRRRGDRARLAVDPDHDVRRGPRAQPRGRHLGRNGRRRRRRRRAAGRRAHRPSLLALDPVHQRPDRPAGRRSPPSAASARAGTPDAHPRLRPARRADGDDRSVAARAGHRAHRPDRLGDRANAGRDRRRHRAAGRLRGRSRAGSPRRR